MSDSKKPVARERETAMGSALKHAFEKSDGSLKVRKTPAVHKPSRRPPARPFESKPAVEKPPGSLAPGAQDAVKTAAKKVAKKMNHKKPGGKPQQTAVDPVKAALQATKADLTTKLRAVIKEALEAGLVVHIPIVKGRSYIKFHDRTAIEAREEAAKQAASAVKA